MAILNASPKYDNYTFYAEFIKIISYFRVKLAPEVTRQYYRKVCPYPLDALEYSVTKWIDGHKPTAGQIPTPNELASACAMWLDERPEMKFQLMTFNKVEDFDYPLEKLFQATAALLGGGEFRFQEFCRANRMPENDIERVACKVRAIKTKNTGLDLDKLAAGIG